MTRCQTCDRTWNGLAEAHCAAAGCHRHFTTVTAFDLHRVGPGDDRRCADPATLVRGDGKPRLSVVLRASGDVWGYPSGGDDHFARQRQAPPAAIASEESVQESTVSSGE